MKTIIYLLLAVFIIGMLPFDVINANSNVRIVIQSRDKNISEQDLKRSSDIISGRLNAFGITAFDIDIEPGRIILKMPEEYATESLKNFLIASGKFEFREAVTGNLILDGKHIESMHTGSDSSGNPYAEIRFDREANAIWAEATVNNLNKSIAIYLDGQLVYDPVVREVITNGSCMISGKFSAEELKYLSILAKNGELPAEFTIAE